MNWIMQHPFVDVMLIYLIVAVPIVWWHWDPHPETDEQLRDWYRRNP